MDNRNNLANEHTFGIAVNLSTTPNSPGGQPPGGEGGTFSMMPLINPNDVHDAMIDVLFAEHEVPNNKPPDNAVFVEALTTKFAFHRERLTEKREKIIAWINALPSEFLTKDEGGEAGWSFLNLCVDKNGHQWGGHRDAEALYALAAGLSLARFVLPRSMWSALPGGVPYIEFNTRGNKETL